MKFQLIDPEEPNLYRNLFPYDEICRIKFDSESHFLSSQEPIFITDTTFRDGQQSRPPYTVKQIVDLFKMLHQLGGTTGVIRQTEFFLYSDKDKKAVESCRRLGYRFPEITGWIRANAADLQLVKEMELRETGILTSASDYHIFLKLKKNRRQALNDYLRIVVAALENGIIPRCHFEDITRADIYGFCVPFAQELMRLSQEANLPVKIRLCDTLGYGVPFAEAVLPRSIPKIIRAMVEDAGVPSRYLEWHGHNDFHKALINAIAAWMHGCSAANGTLLGFGERTGNPPIEGLIIEYISLAGKSDGVDTKVITTIRDYLEKEVGFSIPENMPFVGKNFNSSSVGIHADGLLKHEAIYNIFNTRKILDRSMRFTINDKSGLAGIAHWINTYFGLSADVEIEKSDNALVSINDWIKQQYISGRTTNISDEEMYELCVRNNVPRYQADKN